MKSSNIVAPCDAMFKHPTAEENAKVDEALSKRSLDETQFLQSRVDALYEFVCKAYATSSLAFIRSEAFRTISNHRAMMARHEETKK